MESARLLLAWSPVDGPAVAEWLAANVRVPQGARVTLVRVVAAGALGQPAAGPAGKAYAARPCSPGELPGKAGDAARALAAATGASVDAVEIGTVLRVAQGIAAYATDEAAGALVMGSHGARETGGNLWKVPHTSLDVAAYAPCPLYLVRGSDAVPAAPPPALAPPPPGQGRLVALCLDGSPESPLLTRWAIARVLKPADSVLVVHKPTAPSGPSEVSAVVDGCEQLLSKFLTGGGTEHPVGPHTNVRDAIVDLSERGLRSDLQAGPPPALIILAARGTSFLRRNVLGSVAEYVVKLAASPVCVVPPACFGAAEP